MAMELENARLILPAGTLAVLGLTVLPTLPQLFGALRRRRSYALLKLEYQDEDGKATKESQSKYSVAIQKALILLGCMVGLGLSLAVALRSAIRVQGNESAHEWLFVAIWVFVALEGAYLFVEPAPTKVYSSASRMVWYTVMLGSSMATLLLWQFLESRETQLVDNSLGWGQFGASSLIFFTSITIPRRPDVYMNGRIVDGMRTVPIWTRYTYAWANELLSKAYGGNRIELSDIPELDARRRAYELERTFTLVKKSQNFLVQIFQAHLSAVIQQMLLTVVVAAMAYAPQFFLYKILRTLEARNSGIDTGLQVWIWVVGLGLVKGADAILHSFLYWMCYMALQIPIRAQLSATIFRKTMRKKDVKGSQKADESKDMVNVPGEPNKPPNSVSEEDQDEDDEAEMKNMKQGTINLMAIDATRISDMAAYINIFTESLVGTIIGFSFLIVLIGWQSLLAGIAVLLVIAPINVVISKKYSSAQDRLMKVRDRKMATVSEALQGIRQIKFSALENQWEKRILQVRTEELNTLKSVFINDTLLIACWIANPVLLSVAALGAHVWLSGSLLASTAFTALGIFNELEFTLSVVPELTTDLLDAIVSAKRIRKYLDSSEKQNYTKFSDTIAIRNASIAWAADEEGKERFTLRDVNLVFPSKELSLITGKTGSGKSLLLASLLGEADVLRGHVEMPEPPVRDERYDDAATPANWIIHNSVAYVAQIPWMENASIRDNILFGLPYNESRYKSTLHVCALEKDLAMLTDGEFTEIGANGINLSGGQRWRVSFARALYSRAGILILDDIFSAVDAHVGRHLFEKGLTGELAKGRTRILVTHHMKLCLPAAKYAVSLADGVVEHSGLTEDLRKVGKLETLIEEEGKDLEETVEEELDAVFKSRRQSEVHPSETSAPKTAPKQFVQTEERERGAVTKKVYAAYLSSSGGTMFWVFLMSVFAFQELLVLGRSWYVKVWTNSYDTEGSPEELPVFVRYSIHNLVMKAASAATAEEKSTVFWIGLYAALSLVTVFSGSVRYYIAYYGSLRASRVLFEKLTYTMLRAPLRWLDTVPIGRVLNRFSKDFEKIDSKLGNDIAYLIYNMLGVFGVVAAGLVISPYMIVLSLVLLAISVAYATYYLNGAREVKRLESNSRSPIFELFGSALTGVGTIRSFGKADEYVEKMFAKIDIYSRCTWYVWLLNRWVGIRMSAVGAVFSFVVAGIVVGLPNIDASLAGFALSFSLTYTLNVIWTIRRYANVELDMNSTERIVEYTNISTEDDSGFVPPAAWPAEGRMEFKDLVVSYAPDLPPVLKGLSFEVRPRERVGVVGRTGAGKSSLTLALFQFLRASSGSIFIDGLDISKVSLYHLRSRLAIIPQDPVLFSGTIRSNLDAFNEHEDHELKQALKRVHLMSSTTASPAPSSISGTSTPTERNFNIFESLDSKVSEGGLNLSQGQRQLLCLARAIVSRPKILVLDEATSAVDMQTEALIRQSIHEEFAHATTLVIAHRLHTVINYDRILVLSEGDKVEYDTPWELIKKRGAFWEMLQQSGEASVLEELAREAAGAAATAPTSI